LGDIVDAVHRKLMLKQGWYENLVGWKQEVFWGPFRR